MNIFEAILLAVIEGLTEYLPVSSTGHLILASAVLGLNHDPFVKSFNIIVQFGAILSVLVLYRRRLISSFSFYLKIGVAFIPAAVLGLMLKDKIDAVLGSVEVVATTLLIGGILLMWIDRNKVDESSGCEIEQLSLPRAFLIGLIQCFAFIPGVSRSAASIVGGLALGLNRRAAAEFSFFLAVPTLTGATFVKSISILPTIQNDQIWNLIIGNLVSFLVGYIAIKAFIDYLSKKGFFIFGVYRVVLGIGIFLLLNSGLTLVLN